MRRSHDAGSVSSSAFIFCTKTFGPHKESKTWLPTHSHLIICSYEFTLLFHIRWSSLSLSPPPALLIVLALFHTLCLFSHRPCRFSLIYPVMPLSSVWYILSQSLFQGIDLLNISSEPELNIHRESLKLAITAEHSYRPHTHKQIRLLSDRFSKLLRTFFKNCP